MASHRELKTEDGRTVYEIRVRVSRDRPELSKRWYPPEGWSKKAILRQLAKEEAAFQAQCEAGEVLSRREQKAKDDAEAASIITVHDYGEKIFMPAKMVTCSENTRSSFQTQLDKHIYPVIGGRPMKSITSADVTKLLLDFQASGKAFATVKKLDTVLNLLFEMAYQQDVIPVNPMDKVQRIRPRKDEVQREAPECFTVDELRYILECLQKEPLKWQALVRLEMDSGIRRGETVALTWADVNFSECAITIRGSAGYTPQKGTYIDTAKNRKVRTIDVAPDVMELLRELWREQAETQLSRFVFPMDGNPDSPMHPQTPTLWMRKFGKRYGVEDMHPHKLRHSFATIAITEGADVASVSGKLGHSRVAVTLAVYTHPTAEGQKKAGELFRQALAQKKA